MPASMRFLCHVPIDRHTALPARLQVKKCADAGADIVRITVQVR